MSTNEAARAAAVTASLDALIARGRTPGLQYVVVGPEKTLFSYAGGFADVAEKLPMQLATTLMGYSLSKPFTAAAVLQLVERGKIDLDAPVEQYAGNTPYGQAPTVRQLLAHTAGVPSPLPLRWVHLEREHAVFDEPAALARRLEQHPRLVAVPGARYRYSNLGYWLLGRVVEGASGEAFTEYMARHILEPLGLPPAELDYRVADARRRARGYLEKYSWMNLLKGLLIERSLYGGYEDRWLRIESHYVDGPAFGGLVGSALGFAALLRDQLRSRSALFSPTTQALYYEPQRTNDGAPLAMTLGWHVGRLDSQRYFYKEGGGAGFHALLRLYPGAGIASVILTNATGFPVRRFLDLVDTPFLAKA